MRISDWSSDVCSSDLLWGCSRRPFGLFRGGPQCFLVVERQPRERVAGAGFHITEAAFELGRGGTKRGLGLDAELPRPIDPREPQVAALIGYVGVGSGGPDLATFSMALLVHAACLGPVK